MKSLPQDLVSTLMADMGGLVGLHHDGTLLELAWDSSEPRPVTSHRWADLALLRAVQRYPELSSVLPRRTAGAAECTQCQGTGTPSSGAGPLAGTTCVCGGLGWTPEEWMQERL